MFLERRNAQQNSNWTIFHLAFMGGEKMALLHKSSYIIWYDKTTGQKKLGYIYSIMSTVT